MVNPLKYLVRVRALRKYGSRGAHGICPVGGLKGVAVFVDASDSGAESVCAEVRQYFSGLGMQVLVLCPGRGDLNFAGFMRRGARMPGAVPRNEELFITLADDPACFASEFEARCSPARFKIGRSQLEGDVFDIVVSSPDGIATSQLEAFSAIREYLSKIR